MFGRDGVDLMREGDAPAPRRGRQDGSNVTVQVINNTPVQTREESATGLGGEQKRRFIIDQVGRATASGEFDKQNQARFGLPPRRMKR